MIYTVPLLYDSEICPYIIKQPASIVALDPAVCAGVWIFIIFFFFFSIYTESILVKVPFIVNNFSLITFLTTHTDVKQISELCVTKSG